VDAVAIARTHLEVGSLSDCLTRRGLFIYVNVAPTPARPVVDPKTSRTVLRRLVRFVCVFVCVFMIAQANLSLKSNL